MKTTLAVDYKGEVLKCGFCFDRTIDVRNIFTDRCYRISGLPMTAETEGAK